MKSVVVTKPDESASRDLVAALLCLFVALLRLRDLSRPGPTDWLDAGLFVAFMVLFFYSALVWWRLRKVEWEFTWQGERIRISHVGIVAYDGPLDGIHLLDRDGRGYFLWITPKLMFRMRMGDVPDGLDELLLGVYGKSGNHHTRR